MKRPPRNCTSLALGIGTMLVLALTLTRHVIAAGRAATSSATRPATLPAPTLITLHMHNAKPKAIAAELGKQAGVEMRVADPNHPPVDVDIERQPFWLALRQICSLLGAGPTTTGVPDVIL